MEYARNVLGIADAQHAEYDALVGTLLITPVACPVPDRAAGAPKLSGTQKISLRPGSLAHRIYGSDLIEEEYFCNYELNPAYQARIDAAGLRVIGTGEHGEARIVELPHHRFFLATLYLPQLASARHRPHPLIVAYLRAVEAHREGAGLTPARGGGP